MNSLHTFRFRRNTTFLKGRIRVSKMLWHLLYFDTNALTSRMKVLVLRASPPTTACIWNNSSLSPLLKSWEWTNRSRHPPQHPRPATWPPSLYIILLLGAPWSTASRAMHNPMCLESRARAVPALTFEGPRLHFAVGASAAGLPSLLGQLLQASVVTADYSEKGGQSTLL